MNPPRKPSDPRPGNKPYYIEPNCTEGHPDTPLVLRDVLEGSEGPIWNDEWVCPHCWAEKPRGERELYMDWPQRKWDSLHAANEESE